MKPLSRNRILSSFLLSLACGLLLIFSPPAPAQSANESPAVEIPESLTREEVRELVARLSDKEVRELIIAQLDKLAASEAPKSTTTLYIENLRNGFRQARTALRSSFDSGGRPIRAFAADAWRHMTEDGRIGGWLLLMQLFALLAAGWAAERLTRRTLQKSGPQAVEIGDLGNKLRSAGYRAAVGVLGIGAWAVAAILVAEILAWDMTAAKAFWYQLIGLIAVVRLAMLAVLLLVSPDLPSLQLVPTTHRAAREAWFWSMLLTLTLVLPKRINEIGAEFGTSVENRLLLGILVSLVFLVLAIALIVRLRNFGARLIAGGDGESGFLRQGLARIWWVLAILYVLVVWLLAFGKRAATGESSLLPGIGSLLLVAAIPWLDQGLKWLVAHYFEDKAPKPEADATAESDQQAAESLAVTASSPTQRPDYQLVALRYGRVLMVLAMLAIFVRLWHIDVAAISAQLVGERFARASFDIGITILLTWALWGVIRIAIERRIAQDKGAEGASDEAEAGGVGGTRIGTVLPLIRAFIQITLIAMAVLISLSALGVNIGPLIAGAGVVGLAIGFGAQTLVRDIVSGLFYLIDDAFRVGEYVVVDQIRGTVEKISIRSFQLRHHNGPVHTVPYGEIRTLTNWSRDWAIMKFELRIPFETDIEKVRKIIKKIGQDLMEDETFGPLLLAPLKSQGVNRMDDSALIIRCKFTAVPGQQYLIRREAFTRIQRVFEEQGIHFAPRRVLVEATTPQQATEAAAAAIDREGEGQNKPPPDEP